MWNDKELKINTYCAFINSKLACSMLSRKNWTSTNKMKINEVLQRSHRNRRSYNNKIHLYWVVYQSWQVRPEKILMSNARMISKILRKYWAQRSVQEEIYCYREMKRSTVRRKGESISTSPELFATFCSPGQSAFAGPELPDRH